MSTTPRDRPILFSGPMVRAILEGRKTQTRRVVKGISAETEFAPDFHTNFPEHGMDAVRFEDGHAVFEYQTGTADTREHRVRCPYGQPGDRLWARETWRPKSWSAEGGWGEIEYAADGAVRQVEGDWSFSQAYPSSRPVTAWRPSIRMPRWASRITLEITRIRVERVQDITEADAEAEGVAASANYSARDHFGRLWSELNAPRGFGWTVNPWVWVIDFKRIKP